MSLVESGYASDPEEESKKRIRHGSGEERKPKRVFAGPEGALPSLPQSWGYMNAYERHKHFIQQYVHFYSHSTDVTKHQPEQGKTDHGILKEEHRFLWRPEDEENMTWEKRLAKRYYDKLFKEYCIADLSRYKTGQVGLRWRVKQEVLDGKGQFQCGSKTCFVTDDLQSWEVNFAYAEQGEKKNALVKVRLCPGCSRKLNYKHRRKLAQRAARQTERLREAGPETTKGHTAEGETDEEAGGERHRVDHSRRGLGRECESGLPAKEHGEMTETTLKSDATELANPWAATREKDETELREEELDQYFQDMLF